MGSLKNKADYSQYECPYAHVEKECGHELKGPEGYQDSYSVWCACGYHGPVFCLEPDELGLKKKHSMTIEDAKKIAATCSLPGLDHQGYVNEMFLVLRKYFPQIPWVGIETENSFQIKVKE